MRGHEVEQGYPVMPRRLHAGKAPSWLHAGLLQPFEELLEAPVRVGELERLDDGLAIIVHGAEHMRSLGDVDSDVNHPAASCLSLRSGRG